MDWVAGKVAIISRGAGGLGAASARVLAREGAAVVLADLDVGGAERVLAEIRGSGGPRRPDSRQLLGECC
jgi:NAD(P)-dependent dehydrogenase (short-subunit alcohol dehydrogenase family)